MVIISNCTQIIISNSLLVEECACYKVGRKEPGKKRKLNVFPTPQGKSASGVYLHFLQTLDLFLC
jgi:hypothetical protein